MRLTGRALSTNADILRAYTHSSPSATSSFDGIEVMTPHSVAPKSVTTGAPAAEVYFQLSVIVDHHRISVDDERRTQWPKQVRHTTRSNVFSQFTASGEVDHCSKKAEMHIRMLQLVMHACSRMLSVVGTTGWTSHPLWDVELHHQPVDVERRKRPNRTGRGNIVALTENRPCEQND